MTFDLFRFAWSSSLLLGLAWCAVGLLRRTSADLRHRIWRAALVGTVLLAAPLPVPEGMRITVTALGGPMAAPTEPAAPWLWVVWAAGAALLLARLLGGLARLLFLTRSAAASAQPNIRVGGVSTPLTWGVVQPVILLPAYALEWSEEQRSQAIRHELAHIERRDWLWQVFAQLATAALWFHPLVWLAAAGMRREADRAADDAVLASGAEARGYAAQLVGVARRVRGNAPQAAVAAGVAMVRHKALESRIAAILDETQRRTPSSTRAKAVVPLAAAGLIVILAACQSARVYRVQQVTTPPKPVSIHEPQYSDEARKDKLQGTVVLAVVVDQQGLAQNIHVTRSLGEGLDEKATEAIKQWRFEPGRLKGKPVRVAATIEVNFKLK